MQGRTFGGRAWEGEEREREVAVAVAVAVGVIAEFFKVFSLDRFCTVWRSRSSKTWTRRRSTRFSSRTRCGFNSAVEENLDAWVFGAVL